MKKLISVKEAQKLVAGSEERKDELISIMNSTIESQSNLGLHWAHLPTSANEIECRWLMDELVLNGFSVSEGNPTVSW